MKMEELYQMIEESGFYQYGVVNTADITFSQDVRGMCEVNICRKYGTTWSCPPALGTVEECRERLQHYEKLLVFSCKYDLEDSFDYEGMMDGMAAFKVSCRKLDDRIRNLLSEYLILSNEGCDLCEKCTYPDAPCRFPKRAHGSLEGYGIFVNQFANQAGINYINGQNTVTYFGGLAFHPAEI